MNRPTRSDFTRWGLGFALVSTMWWGHTWALYLAVTLAFVAIELQTMVQTDLRKALHVYSDLADRHSSALLELSEEMIKIGETVVHHGGWIDGHDIRHTAMAEIENETGKAKR